jgi:hypothetical protein
LTPPAIEWEEEDWAVFEGKKYQFAKETVDWENADSRCRSQRRSSKDQSQAKLTQVNTESASTFLKCVGRGTNKQGIELGRDSYWMGKFVKNKH